MLLLCVFRAPVQGRFRRAVLQRQYKLTQQYRRGGQFCVLLLPLEVQDDMRAAFGVWPAVGLEVFAGDKHFNVQSKRAEEATEESRNVSQELNNTHKHDKFDTRTRTGS